MSKDEYRSAVMKRMLRREQYRNPRPPGSSMGHVVIVDWSKRRRGPGAFDWLTEGPTLR